MALNIGDNIPDFTLIDQNGKLFAIKNVLSKKLMVLYFYPKDETAGCTKQACAFRDHYQDFVDAGAEVIGISSDTAESHGSFADHHSLPFVLLSDKNGELRKQFGVPTDLFGIIPGRVTYIVDKQGVIQYVFNSQLRIEKHITEALNILKSLK
jgi:thioredoxin-dependent peroxiredoxin